MPFIDVAITWLLRVVPPAVVVGTVIRPRLRLSFDANDPLCREPVEFFGTCAIGVALRVRVEHVFGVQARGCVAKLVEFGRYGEQPEERGGQELPWKDSNSTTGKSLRRGDIEYANVVEVAFDYERNVLFLKTKTARGAARLGSLPPGAYYCTVRLDADRGISNRVSFGFVFSDENPVCWIIPGSIQIRGAWRRWLGI